MAVGIVRFNLDDRAVSEQSFREVIRLQRVTMIGEENVERMLQRYTVLPQAEAALSLYPTNGVRAYR